MVTIDADTAKKRTMLLAFVGSPTSNM